MQKKKNRRPKECLQCNEIFYPEVSNYDNAKFCKRSCYLENKKQIEKVCIGCGIIFTKPGEPNQKYCNRKCWSVNGNLEERLPRMTKTGKDHPGIKARMKKLGLTWKEYNNWLEWKESYIREVWRITNQQNITIFENYNKRGLAGVQGAYQLDHIIPISYGWANNIPPSVIGDIKNLQIITWEENLKKRAKI